MLQVQNCGGEHNDVDQQFANRSPTQVGGGGSKVESKGKTTLVEAQ